MAEKSKLAGGNVVDGSFKKKAASYKGKMYYESLKGGPAKVTPKAEPEEKGGMKQD